MAKAAGLAWFPGIRPRPGDEGESFEPIDGDWYAYVIRHGL